MDAEYIYNASRLKSLRRTQMMDTPPDPALDRLTRLAASLLDAPVAMVSLVDDQRQFFKSMTGLTGRPAEDRGTPLDVALCKEVVNRKGPLIIADAKNDPQFKDHPAVNYFGLAAYAGIPITLPDGSTLGSFCVVDHKPHNWSEEQLNVLSDLAQSAVSEIVLREQNARQEEFLHRFRSWMEQMPIACFVCDTNFKILEWNSSAQALFGYTRQEALGRSPAELILPEDNRAEANEQFMEMAVTGTTEHSIGNCISQSGQRVVCKWTMNALFESDGEFDGFVAMAEDHTERERLDEQLRQTQKMDAFMRLAGGVAHDFNNLLTVIHGNASLMLTAPTNYREVVECSSQIVHAAERAANLTRQLLTFSRQSAIRTAELNLNTVVEQMSRMFHRVLGENISLDTSLQSDIPHVQADDGLLGQLLLNLIVNAKEAMPQGGYLRISTNTVVLDAQQVRKHPGLKMGTYVVLTVADTGVGISPENLPNIFEPFFSTKNRDLNSGLGLSMVSGIVKQHQARIAVDSKINEGTSFRIYFPALQIQHPPQASSAATSQLARGNETILFAEDDRSIRLLVANMLEHCGYKVLAAVTGIEAIKLWKQHQENVDLLLTDIVLPDGLSGHDLAQTIFEDGRKIPVIYTSGLVAQSQPGPEPMEEGRNFLQKPFDLHKLSSILRDRLDESRSRAFKPN